MESPAFMYTPAACSLDVPEAEVGEAALDRFIFVCRLRHVVASTNYCRELVFALGFFQWAARHFLGGSGSWPDSISGSAGDDSQQDATCHPSFPFR